MAYTTQDIRIFLGTASGAFTALSPISVGDGLLSLLIADVSGNGTPDILAGGWTASTSTVHVLLGTGGASDAAPVNYSVPFGPRGIAIGDLDEDSKLVLVAAASEGSTVVMLPGTGAGAFGATKTYSVGTGPMAVAVRDFNKDGHLDIASANCTSHDITVLNGVQVSAAASSRSGYSRVRDPLKSRDSRRRPRRGPNALAQACVVSFCPSERVS